MRDTLDARKRGDLAFRDKDFKNAIDCYSQVHTRLDTSRLIIQYIYCLALVCPSSFIVDVQLAQWC